MRAKLILRRLAPRRRGSRRRLGTPRQVRIIVAGVIIEGTRLDAKKEHGRLDPMSYDDGKQKG